MQHTPAYLLWPGFRYALPLGAAVFLHGVLSIGLDLARLRSPSPPPSRRPAITVQFSLSAPRLRPVQPAARSIVAPSVKPSPPTTVPAIVAPSLEPTSAARKKSDEIEARKTEAASQKTRLKAAATTLVPDKRAATPQTTSPVPSGAPSAAVAPKTSGTLAVVAGSQAAVTAGRDATGRVGGSPRPGGASGDAKRGTVGTGKAPAERHIASIATVRFPPVPLGQYDKITDYPEEARKQGIEGPVIVRLLIEVDGRVSQVRLVRGLGFGLDQKALTVAKTLRFKPARDEANRPVPVYVPWTFSFRLPD